MKKRYRLDVAQFAAFMSIVIIIIVIIVMIVMMVRGAYLHPEKVFTTYRW